MASDQLKTALNKKKRQALYPIENYTTWVDVPAGNTQLARALHNAGVNIAYSKPKVEGMPPTSLYISSEGAPTSWDREVFKFDPNTLTDAQKKIIEDATKAATSDIPASTIGELKSAIDTKDVPKVENIAKKYFEDYFKSKGKTTPESLLNGIAAAAQYAVQDVHTPRGVIMDAGQGTISGLGSFISGLASGIGGQGSTPTLDEIDKMSSVYKNVYGTDKGPTATSTLGLNQVLQNRYNKIATPHRLRVQNYNSMLRHASENSSAGDIALIYSYMKVQDPTSAVLPGEFATASNSGSIPQIIMNTYNRLIASKGMLQPEQRSGFLQSAAAKIKDSQANFEGTIKPIRTMSDQYGLDWDTIGMDDLETLNSLSKEDLETDWDKLKEVTLADYDKLSDEDKKNFDADVLALVKANSKGSVGGKGEGTLKKKPAVAGDTGDLK